MMLQKIRLDIISDVMCPWCYIGKRRFEAAIAMVPDIDIDVRWRPFQLDATIPEHGMDREAYLNRKFGPEQAKEIYSRIQSVGGEEGLAFDFTAIAKSPNTIDAHRVIRWAGDAGCQDAVVERLFQLYFIEGKDIGLPDVLASGAADCGMSQYQVSEQLKSDKDSHVVKREIAIAQAMGVTGVPAFIFQNTYLVSGAQAPETLADVAHKAASTPLDDSRGDPFAVKSK